MSDEASTPPPQSGDAAGQAADTQAPPPQSEDVSGPASEPEQFSSENLTDKPVTPSAAEPPQSADAARPSYVPDSAEAPPSQEATDGHGTTDKQDYGRAQQATSPPDLPTEATSAQAEAAAPAPEPNAPTTPSERTDTPPQLRRGGEGSIIAELLTKARAKIQDRRRKKLEKIMAKVIETGKISNNEVQKLLRVSDATATRYLDLLEKEGRLRQEGKTGKHVVYIKI